MGGRSKAMANPLQADNLGRMENPWPAASVELVPIASLTPSARNARTHSDEQVRLLAAAMLEYGFTVPVLRDEANGIIAGHGRVLAAELNRAAGRLEFANVPVITARGWSDEQKRAYMIADNQLALRSGWDMSKLAAELSEPKGAGLDLSDLAFTATDLRQIMGSGGRTDPDQAPDLPEVATTGAGDVYALGEHRLICGDATNAETVRQLLGEEKPHLMVTDPPYGIEYDPDWRTHARNGNGALLSTGKGRAKGLVSNDDRDDWSAAWALFPGDVVYCWHAGPRASNVQISLEVCGFVIRSQIVWVKNNFVVGRGDYHVGHETCFYAVRRGKAWAMARGAKTTNGLDDRQAAEIRNRARHAEADRVYEAADREQFEGRRLSVRTILRERDDYDRR
jgi:hypothetical protein